MLSIRERQARRGDTTAAGCERLAVPTRATRAGGVPRGALFADCASRGDVCGGIPNSVFPSPRAIARRRHGPPQSIEPCDAVGAMPCPFYARSSQGASASDCRPRLTDAPARPLSCRVPNVPVADHTGARGKVEIGKARSQVTRWRVRPAGLHRRSSRAGRARRRRAARRSRGRGRRSSRWRTSL